MKTVKVIIEADSPPNAPEGFKIEDWEAGEYEIKMFTGVEKSKVTALIQKLMSKVPKKNRSQDDYEAEKQVLFGTELMKHAIVKAPFGMSDKGKIDDLHWFTRDLLIAKCMSINFVSGITEKK